MQKLFWGFLVAFLFFPIFSCGVKGPPLPPVGFVPQAMDYQIGPERKPDFDSEELGAQGTDLSDVTDDPDTQEGSFLIKKSLRSADEEIAKFKKLKEAKERAKARAQEKADEENARDGDE